MNNKSFKKRSLENHKRLTREMVFYVLSCQRLEKLRKEYDDCLRDVDYVKRRLCDDDLIIADVLITSGADLDNLYERFDELDKEDYVCPYGGVK